MLKRLVPILVSILLLLPASACQSQTSSNGTPVVGNKAGNLAHDFSLKDLNGNTVTLSGLAGRPVVLNFWLTT